MRWPPGSGRRASGPRGNVALEIRQAPGLSDQDAEPDACLWHVRVRGRRQTTPEASVSGGTFPRGPLVRVRTSEEPLAANAGQSVLITRSLQPLRGFPATR